MNIWFHTPLKSPDHPVPSGDREMARALRAALRLAGHRVRTLDRGGRSAAPLHRPERQAAEGHAAMAAATACAARIAGWPARRRPALWFTYHCYYKRPDWHGPVIARALGIPYVIAEASYAPKRAGGPWDCGHRAVAEAVRAADLIVTLNPVDAGCLRPLVRHPDVLLPLRPFIDTAPYRAAAARRAVHRSALRAAVGLSPDDDATPVLLTVAMMRPGDKARSYAVLAAALGQLTGRGWRLAVVGDGEAGEAVRAGFGPVAERVAWLGRRDAAALPALYAGADLYAWPAVNEAWGMTLIEAQAAGLPIVAGHTGGVPNVVEDGLTGLLPPVGDAAAFAAALGALLGDPAARQALGRAAHDHAAARLDLHAAASRLDIALQGLLTAPPAAAS